MAINEEDLIPFADFQWAEATDSILTIGLTDEGVESIAEILKISLPDENSIVDADEVCGEIETPDGLIQIYNPVRGTVIEVNASALESPEVITEDPYGEGWLMKVEAEDTEEMEAFIKKATPGSDDDLEDDDEDDDDDFDENDLEDDDNEDYN